MGWYECLIESHTSLYSATQMMDLHASSAMKWIPISLIASFCLCGASMAGEMEDSAKKTASAWLQQIDAGEYRRSWDESASLFKGTVLRKDWVDTLKKHRAPLGKVISRKFEQAHYTDELPGVPKGDYVVIRILTKFEHGRMAAETITPMLEDGRWRVAGYAVW
jgi:hypothetical protein